MDTDSDSWLKDKINNEFIQMHRLDEELYSGRTKYQEARIIRLSGLGTALVLDGKIQSTERDEFIYHEALVHPAMVLHPCPENIFIAGGGEGATLREILRHDTVKKAVMVDIDAEVTELCKKYLPGHAGGAFEDPRSEVHHLDARGFLEASADKYDVMIIDLPDPIEEGPAYRLFTTEFYKSVYEHLTDNGIIAVQAGSASPTDLLNLTAVHKTLETVFPLVRVFSVFMIAFGSEWGFTIASKGLDPVGFAPAEVDKRLKKRGITGLEYYDGITHQGMFSPPVYIRKAISEQTRVISDDNPLYLYGT
jgi:spermidine synthase